MTPNLYLNYFVEVAEAMGRAARAGVELTDGKRAQITSRIMSKYQTEVVDPVVWERDHPPHTH